MKSLSSKLSRRNFLLAGAGGAATVAVVATNAPGTQPKKAGSITASKGYHVTDHIRKYYNTTKV